MSFKDYKKSPPPSGARILAFSAAYKRDDAMRFRVVTQPEFPLSEVTSYITIEDLENTVMVDLLMSEH